MKKNTLIPLAALSVILACSGCASIINGSKKEVKIGSEPADAKVTVYDSMGAAVQTAQTPTTLKLNRGAGYFKGADYRLLFEKPGYKPTEVLLRSELNGWYMGNLGFGGLIGLLGVDPSTGAMWNLQPDKVVVPLTAAAN